MKKLLLFTVLFVGCNPNVQNPPNFEQPVEESTVPTIDVQMTESVHSAKMQVTFSGDNHWATVTLHNNEEIAAYKEQVEFLLKKLNELEEKNKE